MSKEQIIRIEKADDVYRVFFTNTNEFIGIFYLEIDGEWSYAQWFDNRYWDEPELRALYEYLHELNKEYRKEVALHFAEEKAKETGERPWPGFCQSCKAALYPPDRTDCPSCGACD